MKILSLLFGLVFYSNLRANAPVTLEQLQEWVQTDGLTGLVHGADHDHGFYTFTWSDPKDFFNRFQLSMTSQNKEIKTLFATLNRGDQIWVKGDLPVEKGQPHLDIYEMKVVKKYENQQDAPAGEFRREVVLPRDLLDKTHIDVMVHAVEAAGRVLVLEYRDTIIPMIVTRPDYSKDLFRGDWIRVKFIIKDSDGDRPPHLQLDVKNTSEENPPIKILDKINLLNEQTVDYIGRLVLFPKSPTINMDVWAVEQMGPGGANRYFTLVNFVPNSDGDFEELKKIGSKIKSTWDLYPQGIFNGRNKFIHTELKVHAKGKVTIIDQGQANAQIHLKASDLEVLTP